MNPSFEHIPDRRMSYKEEGEIGATKFGVEAICCIFFCPFKTAKCEALVAVSDIARCCTKHLACVGFRFRI